MHLYLKSTSEEAEEDNHRGETDEDTEVAKERRVETVEEKRRGESRGSSSSSRDTKRGKLM